MADRKTKGKSVTYAQKEALVEFLENNVQLKKQFNSQFTHKNAQQLWEQITSNLNSMIGAKKTADKWRKELYLTKNVYYLTNTDDTAVNNFYKIMSTMLKFVQAEADKKRKDNNLQTRFMAIIKHNNKNDYDEFLTILLCYMAIMKEDVDLMFIIFEDTNSLDELQSSTKIISTPIVACLGEIWSNPKFFVFVDKQCIWREPLAVQEAITIMFISYYVFIQYPKGLAGVLQFLQSCMFGINDEGNKVKQRSSFEKFVPKLLKLMKDYDSYVKKWSC